jgi:hypothetical protein
LASATNLLRSCSAIASSSAFDGLGFCPGLKHLLGALEFNGIEAEVFVDDTALFASHNFLPRVQRQFSRNVYAEEIGEHRLGGRQWGDSLRPGCFGLGVSGPWIGNDVHFGSFLLFGKFSCRALGDLFKVPSEVNV